MPELLGITWAHRRAVEPLTGTLPDFRRDHSEIKIDWHVRSLHGFEFQSVPELAARYDLIILDHPFCGDIAASRCLLPQDYLDGGDALFVGPSLESYRYEGSIWALPVDAASQVSVSRPDLLARLDRPAPETWDEVFSLGERARAGGLRLAIGLQGVHALMTFFFLCANLGRPCATEPGSPFLDRPAAREALQAMRALLAYCPAACLDWNSIDLHEALASRDDCVYCPVVYCYATYAEGDQRHPLRFGDLPGLAGRSPAGSAIGGTGLGISARCRHPEAALAYSRYLSSAEVQMAFADHHGQPARAEAWGDPAVDRRFGGTFSGTRRSIEAAWIRPRYPGYLSVQAAGGDLVEAHLRGDIAETVLLEQLEALHQNAGATAL
jgi:multiple sugar transport system substrate-binding protein